MQVELWDMDKRNISVTGKDIKWSLLPSGYPICQSVNLSESFDLINLTPEFIVFKFFTHKNLGISLHIEDKETSLLKRSLRSQRHDYVGSAVLLNNLYPGIYKRFHLKISQTINLEMDSRYSR